MDVDQIPTCKSSFLSWQPYTVSTTRLVSQHLESGSPDRDGGTGRTVHHGPAISINNEAIRLTIMTDGQEYTPPERCQHVDHNGIEVQR